MNMKKLVLLLLSLCPLMATAQGVVQSKSFAADANSTTVQVSMDSAITNGNALVVCSRGFGADTTHTPSSVGASWVEPSGFSFNSSDLRSRCQYALDVSGAPQTMVVTFGATREYRAITVVEISGIEALNASVAAAVGGSTATDGQSTGNLTTTVDDALLIGVYMNSQQIGVGTGTISAGTNFTDAGGAHQAIAFAESRTVGAAGNYAATFTKSTSSSAHVYALAFEPSAGGGGGVLVNPMTGRGGAAAQPIF